MQVIAAETAPLPVVYTSVFLWGFNCEFIENLMINVQVVRVTISFSWFKLLIQTLGYFR